MQASPCAGSGAHVRAPRELAAAEPQANFDQEKRREVDKTARRWKENQLSKRITRQAPESSQGRQAPVYAAQHAQRGHPGKGGGGTPIAAHAAPCAAGAV